MKAALRHPALHWLLALGLGGAFVYASLDKIAQPAEFARIVYHYRLLGPNLHVSPLPANLLAVTLPWVELVVGGVLISGFWRREAAALTALMLALFIGAVGFALAQGIDIENCGCFSVSGEGRSAGLQLLLADAGMLVGALLLTLAPALPAPARAAAGSPSGEASTQAG